MTSRVPKIKSAMALRPRIASLAGICILMLVWSVDLYGHAPHIQLSKTYVNFWAPPGGPNPQSQTIQLLNTTHARMPWTATVAYKPSQPANWLVMSCATVSAFCSTATPSPQQIGGEFPGLAPCCGAESTNFVLSISLNPTGSAPLTAGVYYATITVSAPGAPDAPGLPNAPPADNTPQVMEVALTVSPTFQYAPGIGVSPQLVGFNGASGTGQSFTQAVSVGNLGGGTLSWTAAVDSASKSWLSVSSQLASQFILTASVGSLPSGTYMGNVIITAPGAANDGKMVPVIFNIRNPLPASIQLGTTSMQFSAIPNAGNPPSQKLTITNTGDLSMNWKALVTTFNGGSWLAVSPGSGTDSGIITVTTTTGTLDPGTYLGNITIDSPGALNSPSVVKVTFIVSPPRPVLTQNGVVNAATFLGGSVAPGEIVSIFGANLGPSTPVVATLDANNQLPTTLGGTTVTFNGVSAPLYFVSGGQVNLQVPYEVANQGSAAITVTPAGLSPASVTIPVADVALGIFAIGTRAAALNQDYSVNTISNPAAPGSVILLYITGQGVVSPKVATGATAPSAPPFPVPTLQPVGVTMNGLQAKVDFAGLAPGFVGLTQINAEVPIGLTPSDNVSVSVGIGFNQAPASVLIAVR